MSDTPTRLVSGSWVLPGLVDAEPIEHGAVALTHQDVITDVGNTSDLRQRYPHLPITHHHAVLMPGLINAHTHLELSSLRGHLTPGQGFAKWVKSLLSKRVELGVDDDTPAIKRAVDDLLAFGTVAVGDVTNTLAAVPALANQPIAARIFHEYYALDQATADLKHREAQGLYHDLKAHWPDNCAYALAAHALYTCHPSIVKTVLDTIQNTASLTSLHLAEHAAERAMIEHGTGPMADIWKSLGMLPDNHKPVGLSPVVYAQSLGALHPKVLAVHLTDARLHELDMIAQAHMPVVLCPRSNLFIEVKLPPLLDMLERGIRPALGTDSLSSNTSLDVLAEAQALSDRFPTVPKRTLIAMLTSYGAEAMQLDAHLGALQTGKQPGIIAVPHAPNQPPTSPEAFVLTQGNKVRVRVADPHTSFTS